MIQLTHVLYISSASWMYERSELSDMLEVFRRDNRRDGLSGMLMYDRGTVIQYIEGPVDQLSATWARIQKDGRHKGLQVLSNGQVESRLFADWSMGFEGGEILGGFDLEWHAVLERTPDHFPAIVRTMMRTFYSLGRPQGSSALHTPVD